MAPPSSSLQDFIPHLHPRLHPHGLFRTSSCQHSHTKSSKALAFPSTLRGLVFPTPESPSTVCSQLRRLLQHSPGKCPSWTHSSVPKPSCLQVFVPAAAAPGSRLPAPGYVLAWSCCCNGLSLGDLYQTFLSGSEFETLGHPKMKCQPQARRSLLSFHEGRQRLAEGG